MLSREDLLNVKKDDVIGNFTIEAVCYSDKREYNRAYLLKCNTCGKLTVRSFKQLTSTESVNCDCVSAISKYSIGSFDLIEFPTYTIVSSSASGKEFDFVIFDNDDMTSRIRDILLKTEDTSIRSVLYKYNISTILFSPSNGVLFRNQCSNDLRKENIVLPESKADFIRIKDLLDINSSNRYQLNYTARMTDEDGFSHGIIYHIACIKRNNDMLNFYFDSDISAGRKLYELEQEICYLDKYDLGAYNSFNDLSSNQSMFYSLVSHKIDYSYVQYLKLVEAADENPLSIFRYGMEDLFKAYGLPCSIHFDLNPFPDKNIPNVPNQPRVNDMYICRLYKQSGIGKKDTYIRCIVGKSGNGDYNLHKINGVHEIMTFNEAVKKHGAKTSKYNTKDGVKPEYNTKGYTKPVLDVKKESTTSDWLNSIIKS